MKNKFKLSKRISQSSLSRIALKKLKEEGPDALWKFNLKTLKILIDNLARRINKQEHKISAAETASLKEKLNNRLRRLKHVHVKCEIHILERSLHYG